jgi:RNA polymerase sigma-70 factor, ECF subfamily
MIISTSIRDSQAADLPLTEQPDREATIVRAARRDPSLFAPIYERYVPRIYAYCLRRVRNPQVAEDLTSLIFMRALASLDQYRGGLVAAWLFRIAHNLIINHRKGQHPELALEESVMAARSAEPLEVLIKAEEEQTLRDLVAALPEDQQDILLLKIVGELSSQEIGAMLGKSAGAVRVALHRILRQLYVKYQEGGPDDAR